MKKKKEKKKREKGKSSSIGSLCVKISEMIRRGRCETSLLAMDEKHVPVVQRGCHVTITNHNPHLPKDWTAMNVGVPSFPSLP